MPQPAARYPLLANFQRQATTVLATVTKEIRRREQELAALKAEAERWQRALQAPTSGSGLDLPSSRRRPARRPRLDWSAVLQALPNRFTTKDLAQKTGKPIAHVYVYASRWMKEKKIRKVKDGYQKV